MHGSFIIALPTNVFDVTGLLWTDFRLKRPANKRIFLQRFPIQVVGTSLDYMSRFINICCCI
jgi:hypothetical protein